MEWAFSPIKEEDAQTLIYNYIYISISMLKSTTAKLGYVMFFYFAKQIQ